MTENKAWGQAFENGRKVGGTEGYARGRKEAYAEAGDLISRKALIDAIVNTPSEVAKCHSGDVLTALADRQNEILALVEKTPAIAVEAVKHGRWIRRGNEMKCSNPKCQFIYYSNHDDFNYCPNCGARMDGDGCGR